MYYPKCKSGFSAFGCCICRPSTPNCGALGFNGGIDLSCAKKVIIGDPVSMTCGAGLIYDAGLCYKSCNTGYYGVGPVCWTYAPKGWVECGMGAAKDSVTCANIIFDQVTAVGNMALSVATLGGDKAITAAKDAAKIAELKAKFDKLKKLADASDKVQLLIKGAQGQFPVADELKSTVDILKADPTTVTPEDIARVAAQIASLVDPTGVAGVVGAYTYPKCSKITV